MDFRKVTVPNTTAISNLIETRAKKKELLLVGEMFCVPWKAAIPLSSALLDPILSSKGGRKEATLNIFSGLTGGRCSPFICYSLIFCWKRLKRPGKVHKKVLRTKIPSSFSPLHKTWARKDHPSPLCLQRGNCCSCNFYRGRTRNWREFRFDQRWGNDDKVGLTLRPSPVIGQWHRQKRGHCSL